MRTVLHKKTGLLSQFRLHPNFYRCSIESKRLILTVFHVVNSSREVLKTAYKLIICGRAVLDCRYLIKSGRSCLLWQSEDLMIIILDWGWVLFCFYRKPVSRTKRWSLNADFIRLHYGTCRIQCFGAGSWNGLEMIITIFTTLSHYQTTNCSISLTI